MIPFLILLCAAAAGTAISLFIWNKKLESKVLAANQETERLRQYCESETARIYNEAQAGVAEAQQLVDQQVSELKQESERVRQHYEAEARKNREEAEALVSEMTRKFEPLQRYAGLGDAEAQSQRRVLEAIQLADNLRGEARRLLEASESFIAEQRASAEESVEDIREQANTRLDQAIRDAGRIVSDAEKRAEQIGGDAYAALRDKQLLEHAAEAIRNIIEGYGDKYAIPTHSVLDDFAEKFGYDEAGRALKSARDQSRRMVEQGQAAACDYVEVNRRQTAIQFVIVAFNGYVDSILSRVKTDNYGTLEQKIRDAFSLVNHNGSAFRNARILPAYLDARLAELKWAVKVQELAARLKDEQRALREEMRDRELAEKEREAAEHEAAKMVELKEAALKAAETEIAQKIANATGEQKKQYEAELEKMRKELAEATAKRLSISQQTSVGHIYIISNEGSFGPGIYKIGHTRRDPEIRVDELYDASVPFEFDIHGVIKTDNSPALEYKLHRKFLPMRLNKKNFHKEFFRVDLKEIRAEVETLAQGMDLSAPPQWRETEAGRVAEWQESRNIEQDSVAREKWLKRELASADEKWQKREKRLARQRELNGAKKGSGESVAANETVNQTSTPGSVQVS
jgi:hypothetical protein